MKKIVGLGLVVAVIIWGAQVLGEDHVGGKRAGVVQEDAAHKTNSVVADKKAVNVKDKINPKKLSRKEKMVNQAPEKFKVVFVTTQGKFLAEATRSWSPKGVDRFYDLVQSGFFKDIAFFRVIPNFMAQFGIHGDPQVSAQWRNKNIEDDPQNESNKAGYISFATSGSNTRTTQMFINFGDNTYLDKGFTPVARVIEGMDVVNKIYSGYGESPSQELIQRQGNSYLKASFPKLDYIQSAEIKK